MLTMEFFHLFLLAACVGYLFFRMGQVKAYRDMNNVLDKITEFTEELEKDKQLVREGLVMIQSFYDAVERVIDNRSAENRTVQ